MFQELKLIFQANARVERYGVSNKFYSYKMEENSSDGGRLNSEGRHRWWGVPGRTLEAVLEHIEGSNTPRLEYPAPPSFSHRRGSSWTPRHMDPGASSSSSDRSTGSPCLGPVKPEPQDTPVSQRTRSSGVRIADPSPTSGRLVLVRPKAKAGLPAEYEVIARRGFSDGHY